MSLTPQEGQPPSATCENLKEEAKHLGRMLRNLQRGITYDLLADDGMGSCGGYVKPEVASAQRRNVAKSCWAKSGSKREFPGSKAAAAKSGPSSTPTDFDLLGAERNLKKRAASYSIGRARRDDLLTRRALTDVVYDPNLDAVSTSKRSRNAIKFSTERRNIGPSEENKDEAAPGALNPMRQQDDGGDARNAETLDLDVGAGPEREEGEEEVADKMHLARSAKTKAPAADQERLVSKRPPAYSFPKAQRNWAKNPEPLGDRGIAMQLDVERAERYLNPNAPTAIMRPRTCMLPPASAVDDEWEDEEGDMWVQEEEARENNLNVLSTYSRTSCVSIRPPSVMRADKVLLFGITSRSPGPGTYNVEAARPGIAANPAGKGKMYHTESKKSHAVRMLAAEKKHAGPGVGDYDVDKGHRIRGGVVMKAPNTEPTPHQLRKKYWEDKAQDLRLDHDDMHEACDAWLRPHTPSFTMAPQKETDWQRRMIQRRGLQERINDAQGGDYDVNRSLVEPRSRAPAGMAAQAAAEASTRKRLADKPMVVAALTEKKAAEAARDKFYGPQLQVAWAAPGQPEDEDSGNESPTEEIIRMLAWRADKSAGTTGTAEEKATAAYLRSSLAAPAARATVIMRPPAEKTSRSALVHPPTPPAEFLGPQLSTDWLAESEARHARYKNRAIMMDLGAGRDVVQVKHKGEVQVDFFYEHRVRATGPLGPGRYDPLGPVIGDNVKGVPFKQLVSRGDAIGPEGERPESAAGNIAEIVGETFLGRDRLDIEYGTAKDASKQTTKKGLSLYSRERHAPPDEDGSDAPNHLGGSWFEGIAEGIVKMAPVVRMDKMNCRSVADQEELMEEVTGVKALGPVQIEVKDWNPRMPKAPPGRAFQDIKAFPRFEEAKKEGGAYEPLSIKDLDPVKGMAVELAKKPAPLMSRMAGRGGSDVLGDDDGYVDIEAALELAHARAAAVKKAEESLKKRTPTPPNMGKQRGREETPIRAALEEVERQANHPPAKPLLTFGNMTKGMDFSKIGSSNKQDDAAAEAILRAEGLLHNDQLDIQPDPAALYKAAPAASMGDPKKKEEEAKKEVIRKPEPLTTRELVPIKGTVSELAKKSSVHKSTSVPKALEEKILRELGLAGDKEQLEVTPDDSALKKPVKGGSIGGAGLVEKKKSVGSRNNSQGILPVKVGEEQKGRVNTVHFDDLAAPDIKVEPVMSLPELTPPNLRAPAPSTRGPERSAGGKNQRQADAVNDSTEISNMMAQLGI